MTIAPRGVEHRFVYPTARTVGDESDGHAWPVRQAGRNRLACHAAACVTYLREPGLAGGAENRQPRASHLRHAFMGPASGDRMV